MGNHTVGQAMGLGAEQALKLRRPKESALSLLDRICAKYEGMDAEFEAEDPHNEGGVHPDFEQYTDPHPKAILGLLMVEAFAPNGLDDLPKYAPMLDGNHPEEAEAFDVWDVEVNMPFRARYNLC